MIRWTEYRVHLIFWHLHFVNQLILRSCNDSRRSRQAKPRPRVSDRWTRYEASDRPLSALRRCVKNPLNRFHLGLRPGAKHFRSLATHRADKTVDWTERTYVEGLGLSGCSGRLILDELVADRPKPRSALSTARNGRYVSAGGRETGGSL